MLLTDKEKRMLGGESGPGVQKALSFLVEYGEAFDAQRLVRVDSAHLLPDPVHMLNELTEGVAAVGPMTTLHSLSPLVGPWVKALGLREDSAGPVLEDTVKAVETYKALGCFETLSCAPYVMGNVLKKGNVFSWAGSSGIIINNSLFGARGNRDSGIAMTCSAITGRTPELGRIRAEERFADVVVRFQQVDVAHLTEDEMGAIGYHIGALAQTKNVAIDGLPPTVPFEKLKYLLSPMPVSGAVSLCHLTGITPEAPTLEAALGNRRPELALTLSPLEMRDAASQLCHYTSSEVEVVALGCPHLTMGEIREIAFMLAGKRVAHGVRLILATNEGVLNLSRRMGYADLIEKAGGLIITDSCIAVFPFAHMKESVDRVATNSARCAHYLLRGGAGEVAGGKVMDTYYGSTEQCIGAAMTGKWEER